MVENVAQFNNRGALVRSLRVGRILLTGLPLSTSAVIAAALYEVIFSLIQLMSSSVSYIGANCVFKITPGTLLKNSPLAAEVANGISFPAFPVKVANFTLRISNTTAMANKVGKWAAVYIPFREEHDNNKYDKKLTQLSYSQLCELPFAKSGNCNQDLVLTWKGRDRSDYCNRARELNEPIGIIAIVWSCCDRNDSEYKNAFTNTDFSCDLSLSGTVHPMITLGAQSREIYPTSSFEPFNVTKSSNTLYIYGSRGQFSFYGTEDAYLAHIAGSINMEMGH